MTFHGSHAFEFIEGPNKILKLKEIGQMGPHAHGDFSPAVFNAYRDTVLHDLHYATKKVFNEGYFIADKTMAILEPLAKAYKFETLVGWFKRYWLDMAQIEETNRLSLEAKNRPDMEHENMKLIRAFKDEIELTKAGPAMREAKISYLEKENTTTLSCLNEMEAKFQCMEDHDYEGWLIEIAKKLHGYEKLAGKYRSNKITIAHLQGVYDKKKIVVTDDMIALAKKVPFNKLLKLEVVGNRAKALCPFHNENTPSFVVYADTNRGHCHGCGKNVDTIQYLVEIKKLEFNQAVLMLLSY